MKNTYLYIAACMFLCSLSFSFNGSEVTWMWEEKIQVPVILIGISVVLVGLHLFKRRTRSTIF